jgi:DNA mismatch repair protein MutS
MDEIGRGTSTFDGLSLAWAAAVHLARGTARLHAVSPRTTSNSRRSPSSCPRWRNVHLDAVEHRDHVVFMHRIQEGPASRSFGLQVAARRRAGTVLAAAAEKLGNSRPPSRAAAAGRRAPPGRSFQPAPHPALALLADTTRIHSRRGRHWSSSTACAMLD